MLKDLEPSSKLVQSISTVAVPTYGVDFSFLFESHAVECKD